MAQYDGSIRINTKIDNKQASVQLMTLENRIVKTADKIAGLRSKMDALKDAKIPTQEYSEISTQIQKAESEFNKLLEKQEQMQREGKDSGVAWERLNEKMEETGNTIRYAQGELQDLIDTGKAFTLGSDTEEFAKLGQQLQYAESDLSVLNRRHDELIEKQGKTSDGYKKLGNTAKKSLEKINNTQKKSNSLISTMGSRFKSLALSLLIFNQISKAFRALTQSIKEGFTNLYEGNKHFKSSVDSLKASILTLKNTLAAAFSPLVEIAIPYIQRFIEWLTSAINMVGQFIAALTGRKTYTRAIKQSAAASEEAAEATEEETEAMNKQLSPLDKLNVLTSENAKEKEKDDGLDTEAGAMFEEVPIDNKILDFLQKLKDFLAPIIDYAKKLKDVFMQGFWDGLGDWEYRWESIKDSIASIKDSLIDIFTDPAVLAAADSWAQSVAYMLGSLAGSVASIGLTIATNFIGGIAKYLEQNKERIKEYLISMFNIWEDINYLLADFFQAFAYVFEAFASEEGQQLTANIIGIFTDAFMGITELASKFFREIANIIIQPFVDNKEGFRTALEGFLGVLAEVIGTIKQGIDETFNHLNKIYDEHLKPFFDSVAQGLSDLTGQFLEFWNNDVQPILDKWAEKFDVLWKEHIQPALDKIGDAIGRVADFLKDMWEKGLKPIISWIIDNILPVLLPIIDELFTASMEFVGWLFDVIGGLMDFFMEFVNFVSNILKGDLVSAAESAKNMWAVVWNGIVNTVGAAVNKISEWISKLLGLFGQVSTAARGMTSGGLGRFMGGGFNAGGRTITYSATPAYAAFQNIELPKIPKLATGAVIPANKEFLAVLGDQKHGTNIEAPLATIEEAVINAIAKVNANSGNNNGGSQEINLNLTVECEGYRLIQLMKKLDGEYFKQAGRHVMA